MTSSNHVLLISDEDNVRTRKTSTSSSLDSWDGLGLGDEPLVSNPHTSRSRPFSNATNRSNQTRSAPMPSVSVPGENPRPAFTARNLQAQKNVPVKHGFQQKLKSSDSSKLYDLGFNAKKIPADKMVWYCNPPIQEGTVPTFSPMQSIKQSAVVIPASHITRAERVPGLSVNSGKSGPQNSALRQTSESPMRLFQKSSQQSSPVDQTEKMKTKLLSVWNNVKYGWTVRTKTSFNCSSPIYLLGQKYKAHNNGEYHPHQGESTYEKFLLDFSSRVWLTYRRDFPFLDGSTLGTDCGWGCMLRSGQMMLAQALLTHFLGRSWRLSGVPQTEKSDRLHRMIVRWFGDLHSDFCPFSIHHLVEIGKKMGKKAGDWYGPASVAFLLKQAMEAAANGNPPLDDLCVYVAQDCTVYKKDVIELCTRPNRIRKIGDCNVIRNSPLLPPHRQKIPPPVNCLQECTIDWKDVLSEQNYDGSEAGTPRSSYRYMSRDYQSPPKSPLSRTWSNPFIATSNDRSSPYGTTGQSSFPLGTSFECVDEPRDRWRSLIVLIPARLGGERLNRIYFPCINKLLEHECSIGIIGGRPRHSLYFVGFQDDKLINLDPHYCQEMVDVTVPNFPLDSFQCTDPRKIPVTKMDPSCTIGFYFRTRDDFEKFTETVDSLLSAGEGKADYPIFIVSSESSLSSHPACQEFTESIDGPMETNSDFDEEDFVLL